MAKFSRSPYHADSIAEAVWLAVNPIAEAMDERASITAEVSDDDGIGALFDEIGHLYPCENPF